MDGTEFQEGKILLIDKPIGWTSFDVVNKIRYLLKKTFQIKKIKVGHTGTLDPLATGLLVLCTGRFTKRIPEFQGLHKEYTGTFMLGSTTASFDLETPVNAEFPLDEIDEEKIRAVLPQFTGKISQVPPTYSAKKVDGKRSYKAARGGIELDIPAQDVVIERFDIDRVELPEVDFDISCSKGTYIRALARDLGKALGNGGHLSALRRTRVGDFSLEDAITIDQLIENVGNAANLANRKDPSEH